MQNKRRSAFCFAKGCEIKMKEFVCPQHGKVIANYLTTSFPVCNICLEPLIEVETK
jgi:hypothetical protein